LEEKLSPYTIGQSESGKRFSPPTLRETDLHSRKYGDSCARRTLAARTLTWLHSNAGNIDDRDLAYDGSDETRHNSQLRQANLRGKGTRKFHFSGISRHAPDISVANGSRFSQQQHLFGTSTRHIDRLPSVERDMPKESFGQVTMLDQQLVATPIEDAGCCQGDLVRNADRPGGRKLEASVFEAAIAQDKELLFDLRASEGHVYELARLCRSLLLHLNAVVGVYASKVLTACPGHLLASAKSTKIAK
jgi:hypothetical protein